ncbi:hypothetical protein HWV07_01765 [Natronomonas salina]|uniref:hypothetical protein n=1 Tax=Natronomonas salina TaxID=1710540 RepID=UPI0015B3C674|nr:hypothetical protein [Natronomonas salina]QLD87830.1 hypothetical protein HWV07_01765 [Natronomonas salina]
MWLGRIEHEMDAGRRFEALYESMEAGAFWAAVVFPVGYVPFLTAGIGGTERALAFAGLVTAHLLLLTVGHAYER